MELENLTINQLSSKHSRQNVLPYEEITQLRHEYKILENLSIDGIIKVYNLEKYKNSIALIEEDFKAKSLKQYVKSKNISINEFLIISIQLVKILGDIHQNSNYT